MGISPGEILLFMPAMENSTVGETISTSFLDSESSEQEYKNTLIKIKRGVVFFKDFWFLFVSKSLIYENYILFFKEFLKLQHIIVQKLHGFPPSIFVVNGNLTFAYPYPGDFLPVFQNYTIIKLDVWKVIIR